MSKIITVFGATGNQGGSVIKHILAHPQLSKEYKIRAVTRDVTKPKAIGLEKQGAELVTADLGDVSSVEKAIHGSSVVFGVTNYWEHMKPDLEIQQGKNLVDASLKTGAHLIWSSLPAVSKATNGELTSVHHFDSKAEIEEYARSLSSSGLKATFFMPGIFMSVALENFHQQGGKEYIYSNPFTQGDKEPKIPFLDPAADTGLFVAAILLQLDESNGKRILGSGGNIKPSQMVKDFEAATGKKAALGHLTWDQFRGFLPEGAADEMVGNFQLMDKYGYYVGEPDSAVDDSIDYVKKAGLDSVTTWREYVRANWKE